LRNLEFGIGDESRIVLWLRGRGVLSWFPRKAAYRAIVISAVAWVPLLLLSAANGVALGGDVEIPFLRDLVAYARFVVALPIAIVAGDIISPRVDYVLGVFYKARMVRPRDIPRLERVVEKAKAIKNSLVVEFVLLALVYAYVATGIPRDRLPGISSWTGHSGLTDLWFLWVSMPLFLFPLFLWLWRILVWGYLLLGISRLRLRILATHPDGVGGLNFVNTAHRRFAILVLALSTILCAAIAEEIVLRRAVLRTYESELVACFAACLGVILGPLLPFTRPLVRAKLRGWRYYGALASRYVQGFDDKWIQRKGYDPNSLLGTPDIQSLADLKNSYQVISEMRTVLPERRTIGIYALAYLVPVIPLLTTAIPLRQVLTELYKLLIK
jgi:hypothetical protein